MEIYLWTSS